MAKLKKINKTLKDSNDTCEVNVTEFIPYACHFNPNTLLTKNGELLQTIKITGFAFETVKNEQKQLLTIRQAIRKAIKAHIPNTKFAVYLHTFRRKSNLSTGRDDTVAFLQDLGMAWEEYNQWDKRYTNELYLTIMIEGQALHLTDIKTFFRSLYFKKEFEHREKYLDDAHAELSQTVDKILSSLESYGAKRLQIYKDDGIYYSEITSFLGKIINLKEERIPLAGVDIAEVLPSHRTSFGFNTLISAGDTGKHYGAIFTVKAYHEITSHNIDDFLQTDQQFIVTESFDFVNHKEAFKEFSKQMLYHTISNDDNLSRISGLDDIIESNTGSPLDFGEHQISIMVVEDTPKLLQEGIEDIYYSLSSLGIAAIREDIFLEDCYWAQLPGNFEFNKRMSPVTTNHMGGFASLYSFPAGKRHDNHWGDAITTFYTVNNTPYFFNFHYEDNGHTFIIGPFGSGKTVLMNFLVAQAMKFNTKLFFFDHLRGAEIFIKALDAPYKRISDNPTYGEAGFNPLLLEDSQDNREFLRKWFAYLMGLPFDKISDEDKKKIDDAIAYSYGTLEPQERRLSNVIPNFWPVKGDVRPLEEIEKEIIDHLTREATKNSDGLETIEIDMEEVSKQISAEQTLSQWYENGRYAYLFDNLIDEINFAANHIFAYDFTDIVSAKVPLIPTIYYLMHRIEQSLDGSPTIIVLDEAWTLIDNYAFNDHIEQWLTELRKKNTMVIFATESVDGAEKSPITKILAKEIETKIFLPNTHSTPVGYEEVFGLNDAEYALLQSMDSEEREFLLIHNIDAVVCRLDLAHVSNDLYVLSSTPEALGILESATMDVGHNSKDWLPLFKERLSS